MFNFNIKYQFLNYQNNLCEFPTLTQIQIVIITEKMTVNAVLKDF